MWAKAKNLRQLVDWNVIERDLRRSKQLRGGKKLRPAHLFFRLIISHNTRLVVWVRIATFRLNLMAKIAQWRLKGHYSIEIGPNVRIGEGLLMPHPMGIIIGSDVILGKNVTVGQHVTLGGNFKKSKIIDGERRKTPIIGDRVWIAAGSVVAGPVIIGNDVVIAANSVITKNVPPNTLVYGRNRRGTQRIILDPHEGTYKTL